MKLLLIKVHNLVLFIDIEVLKLDRMLKTVFLFEWSKLITDGQVIGRDDFIFKQQII